MTTATTTTGYPFQRRPRIALLLSFLMPGLGHIYCGVFGRGIALLFASMMLGALGAFVFLPAASWFRVVAGVSAAVSTGVWVYAMWAAPRIARRTGPDYTLKDYNRWYVYLVLWLMMFPAGISLGMYVRAGIVQAFHITSPSMFPTISQGDRVLVNKLAYREGPVQRGDIVVLHNPNNRSQANIKRVVALPGDTVEIKDGLLYVNDKKLERQLVGPSAAEGSETLSGEIYWETNGSAKYRVLSAPPTAPTAPTTALTATAPSAKSDDLARRTVPNGRCLVLGDNRSHSSDSRDYGPVPLADLIGRAECIYWPRWENLRK